MKEGFITEVEIVRWRDGDTPIVRICREFPVRLIDSDKGGEFDCPEKNTNVGIKAKRFAEKETKKAKKILLFIPSKNPIKFTDIYSFDRVLGEIYLDEHKITDLLTEAGFGNIK